MTVELTRRAEKIGRRAPPKTTMRYCYHNDTLRAQTWAATEHDTATVAKHECGLRPRPRIVSALCHSPYNCTTAHAHAAVEDDVDSLQTKTPIATV